MDLLLVFTGVALLTTFSPGPAVLFTLQNALAVGAAAAWRGALGNATGLLLMATAGFGGVNLLLMQSMLAFTLLKIAGAAYLIYLAVQQWRQARYITALQMPLQNNSKVAKTLYWQGILVALTNPKAWLFISALMPQFLDLTKPLATQFMLLALVFALCSLLSHASWLLIAKVGLQRSPAVRYRQWMARAQALLLTMIACSLWWTPMPV